MRKTVMIVLACLYIAPMIVQAQEQVSLWELTQVASIESLGVEFNIPDGWVTDSTGFMFAENQDDLTAVTDDEANTQPSGLVIVIYGLSLTANENGMPRVEEAVNDFLLSSSGDISEYQYGVVNLRPSISLRFTGSDTDTINLFTFWIQADTLISLQLITPNQTVDARLTSTWEQIVSSVRPILPDDFEFADEPYEVSELGFSVVYPEGWAAVDARVYIGFPGVTFAFNENDAGLELPRGVVIDIYQDLNRRFANADGENVTPNEATYRVANFLEENPVNWEGEFVVFEQHGIGLSYNYVCCELSPEPVWFYHYFIATHDQSATAHYVYLLIAPNEELFDEYLPVFLAMIRSIQPLES